MFLAASSASAADSLESVALGTVNWLPLRDLASSPADDAVPEAPRLSAAAATITASFVTYLTHVMIVYDPSVNSWWCEEVQRVSLMERPEREDALTRKFGQLARSVGDGVVDFLDAERRELGLPGSAESRDPLEKLAGVLIQKYCDEINAVDGLIPQEERLRQMGMTLSLLSKDFQPTVSLTVLFQRLKEIRNARKEGKEKGRKYERFSNFEGLLSSNFDFIPIKIADNQNARGRTSFAIRPTPLPTSYNYEEAYKFSSISTPFGPLASEPLRRNLPRYGLSTYARLAAGGAAGCAITHSLVIPLDVVKTRIQTEPDRYDGSSLIGAAVSMVQTEGPNALLLGAQATVAGYFWYGVSVYPSYEFFKRFLSNVTLRPDVAAVHGTEVGLVAGALAAVVASIGLTPLEACRIRTVAEPETYRSLGLAGTAAAIAAEGGGGGGGAAALYAGFTPLLLRQVIFGTIKFVAFERACEAIFGVMPTLRDSVPTSLAVTVVGGVFAGVLSSTVSQPADSVLTYIARQSEGAAGTEGSMDLIGGSRKMVAEGGFGSLFRGLGSRCVWAGGIIAGQFLLYDIFRSLMGVSRDDLTQIFQVVVENQT